MKNSLKKSLAVGLFAAAIGAITGVLVAASATGSGYEWFLGAAPIAAFLTGTALWWLIVARGGHFGTLRGVLTGALAGAVGHYVCWVLFLLGGWVCHALTGGCTSSLGEAPMNPLQSFAAAGLYTMFSLLFFGWLTVPAGAILGGLLTRAQRKGSTTPPVIRHKEES